MRQPQERSGARMKPGSRAVALACPGSERQRHVAQVAAGLHQHQRAVFHFHRRFGLTRHTHRRWLGRNGLLRLTHLLRVGLHPLQASALCDLAQFLGDQHEGLGCSGNLHGCHGGNSGGSCRSGGWGWGRGRGYCCWCLCRCFWCCFHRLGSSRRLRRHGTLGEVGAARCGICLSASCGLLGWSDFGSGVVSVQAVGAGTFPGRGVGAFLALAAVTAITVAAAAFTSLAALPRLPGLCVLCSFRAGSGMGLLVGLGLCSHVAARGFLAFAGLAALAAATSAAATAAASRAAVALTALAVAGI